METIHNSETFSLNPSRFAEPESKLYEYTVYNTFKEIWYPSVIVDHNSTKGQQFLRQSVQCGFSRWKQIEPFFEKQQNGAFCGIASSVIVCNTLYDATIWDQKEVYMQYVVGSLVKDDEEMRGGLNCVFCGNLLACKV
jgi:hypothetical protein